MLDALADPQDAVRASYQAPGIGLAWCARASVHRTVVSSRGETLHAATFSALTNANTLRRELAALGHHFHSSEDDELVLRAYEQWGHHAFSRLRGPFVC